MLTFGRAVASATILLAMSGCSGDPDPFGSLDDPTPNVLRGTYKTEIDEPAMAIDLRFTFDDDKIFGAVRCSPKQGGDTIEATGSVPVSTDFDAAEGSFTIGALVLSGGSLPLLCEAGLRAGTYDFKLDEFLLTLTAKDVVEPLTYVKIGD